MNNYSPASNEYELKTAVMNVWDISLPEISCFVHSDFEAADITILLSCPKWDFEYTMKLTYDEVRSVSPEDVAYFCCHKFHNAYRESKS